MKNSRVRKQRAMKETALDNGPEKCVLGRLPVVGQFKYLILTD